MIRVLSRYLLRYLISSSVIETTDKSLKIYKYGTEIFISSLVNIAAIVAIGILTFSIKESVLFMLLLVLLRIYTGGYHANTYLKCNLLLCINYILVLVFYNLTPSNCNAMHFIFVSITCVAIILLFCPVENENKKITTEKKIKLKKKSVILGTIYGTAAVVFNVFKYRIGILILYTLSSVTIAVIAAKLKERWGDHG